MVLPVRLRQDQVGELDFRPGKIQLRTEGAEHEIAASQFACTHVMRNPSIL